MEDYYVLPHADCVARRFLWRRGGFEERNLEIKLEGLARPSPFGERKVTQAMYVKGKNFMVAAILLQKRGGNDFVVLHLLCQGIELILKAFLLFSNYKKYKPDLWKKKKFGHDLLKLADEVSSEFGIKSLRPPLAAELGKLNDVYSTHQLRYVALEILMESASIPRLLVLRRIVAAVRLADRHLPA